MRSTGHSTNRLTALPNSKVDGTKLKPYVIIPRKRQLPDLVKTFSGKAVLKFEGSNWMKQPLADNGAPMFTPQRLLVWGSFKCHSDDTKAVLRKTKVQQSVIPGGCTGFIQAPDISWNKPSKNYYTKCYEEWFEGGKQEFTADGNPKSAPLEDIIA